MKFISKPKYLEEEGYIEENKNFYYMKAGKVRAWQKTTPEEQNP